MYHDESWVNVGEEKRSIWIDDSGRGRIRKGDGKGKTTEAFVNILYITIYI
jgi:ATP:corrinoid adenosyltransferase